MILGALVVLMICIFSIWMASAPPQKVNYKNLLIVIVSFLLVLSLATFFDLSVNTDTTSSTT